MSHNPEHSAFDFSVGADISDLDGLMSVETDSFSYEDAWSRQAMRQELIHNPEGFIVARDGRKIVGYIQTQIGFERIPEPRGDSSEGVIGSIAVLEKYRQRGLGRELLQKGLDRLWSLDVPEVMLTTRVSNQAMINLAQAFKFNPSGVIENYFENPDGSFEDAWRMVLVTKPQNSL